MVAQEQILSPCPSRPHLHRQHPRAELEGIVDRDHEDMAISAKCQFIQRHSETKS
jgi:hypothetical protein